MQARPEPIMGFEGLERFGCGFGDLVRWTAFCQSFDNCFWLTHESGFYRHCLQKPDGYGLL